ncbi:MAG: choice-of-anchor D domain-containing protein, partial [Myxococcales bacterium]|nr:choice-of-anchor D domain-containing protein [Myxococcales bacterium]
MRMQRLWVSIAALCFGVLAFAEGSAWAAAEFSVDATSHDFGDSHVGTAKTFDFTISNVGTGNDLDITGFAPTGTECGDYVLSPASFTGGNKIAPGNSAVLTVTFTPGARGTRGCVFTSTDNDGNSTDTITLTGNGTSPTMTTTAGPLTFASTHVGTSAATQTITINNTSTDNDNLAFMVVVTSGNLHYTAIPASGSIPAGMSADITVTFTPAAKGSLPGNVRITGNDVANSQDDVVLAGTGTSPDMVVSPLAINFGNQRVSAGPTVAQLVTVQNAATGNEDLTFTYTELGPDDTDFSVAAPAMMTLAPGASTTLSIAFDPTASGARSDDLQIDGNDAFNASDTVALSGTGTEAIIAPNPAATLSIGNVTVTQNATGNIAVGNTGNTTLTVSSMTISGTNASEFSFASQGCAGQQCNNAFQVTAGGPATTVTIRCSPTSQGAKSALLTFTGDQDSGDNQVNLTCTGTRSVIAVNPLSLSFPDTKVGTTAQLTFTVANNATGTGAADLTYTIAKGGAGAAAFTVAPACTTTCTRTVGSAAQTHTVTFTPTARQDYAATLTITSNDLSNTPITITLTGKGIAPLITNPNPAGRTVAFGNVDVGTTSAASTISVQNTGDASLAITSATLTGANANQFRISSGTVGNQTVNVSGTATWQVVCEPTSIGAKTATFRITSDGFGTATYDFTLTCTGQRAEFVFAPAAGLNFGQVPVGNSSTLPVTITNNGNKTGTISSITSSNAVFTFAVVGGMPPRTVAAGASLTVNVTFTPANGNVLAEHLTVMTDGPPNSSPTSFQIPLAGDGTTMGIDVSVLTEATLNVDLGGLRVNTTAVRTVRVGNEGDTPFTLSAPSSSAGACTFGTFSPGLPAVIAGGGVATFNVNVTPTALGAGSCALTVSSSLPSTDTINIVWDGIAPEVALVNPASGPLDFAGVDVDAAPVTVAVQLRNSGTDTLNIASCAIVGSARFTVQSCPNLQVAEGATASIDVTFDPTVEAIETATLNLAVDAFSTNQVQVPLTGIGVDQNINLPSLLYEFPDTFRNPDDAPTLDIVVENPLNAVTNAGAPLTVSMAMSDETPVFEVQTPGPLTIDPDGQAGVTVSFSPTAAGITFEGTVTIVNDSTAQPMAQVTVRGRGVSRQVMQPMVCDLGTTGVNVPVKLSDLTDDSCAGGLPLTNIDPDGVTYRVRELAFVDDNGDPVTGAPFTLLDGADERMLAPAQTTLYDVEFAPTKSGQFEVYLAVYLDGDPVEHARITLRGHAVDVDVHGGGCQTGRGGVG